ncbi:Pre-mRNA-splicing factor ATP-dependent RNA helicase DEAH10 [Porphyridium purpureum]|uniref:RNA helicase n=1 Tax=Porphyridium purpureum TaxID=35688 RepID=A0A5J4YZ75_PORPP|nr:Pre-mRNA-splicing factor ATP-dependent RNA helicase DEAH10 [Porphyridium purpureum]|eukprot:POR4541..scf208_2
MGSGAVGHRESAAANGAGTPTGQPLPILVHARDIVDAYAACDVLVLAGETGCGKSTQLPQILLDNRRRTGVSRVVITQPRRLAAISVAARVAHERECELGTQVGYAVRFENKSGPGTQIRYVTHGVLLREACSSSTASLRSQEHSAFHLNYDAVIIDEVHERDLNTDLLLGMAKTKLLERKGSAVAKSDAEESFKLVVMSATADIAAFTDFFSAPCRPLNGSQRQVHPQTPLVVKQLIIPGRAFPVERLFTEEPVQEYVNAAVTACAQIHADEPFPGDVLCFLSGQDEIDAACALLKDHLERYLGKKRTKHEVLIMALYATLAPEEQQRAIEPLPVEVRAQRRKIIFSTNVAETSITIPGVRYVVDSGMCKMRVGTSASQSSLQIVPISRAQAAQRAGRAGRECAGKAFSLYPERALFSVMPEFEPPEITRCDLASAMLTLFALGTDVRHFDFMDAPSAQGVQNALELLVDLGALDEHCEMNAVGRAMAALPVGAMVGRAFLEAMRAGCAQSMAMMAALLSVEGNIYASVRPERRAAADKARRHEASALGDMISVLNVFEKYLSLHPRERGAYCRDLFISARTLNAARAAYEQLLKLQQTRTVRQGANALCRDVYRAREPSWWSEPAGGPRPRMQLQRCLVAGFSRHAASLLEAPPSSRLSGSPNQTAGEFAVAPSSSFNVRYKGLRGGPELFVHPSSVIHWRRRPPHCILYQEILITSKLYVRNVLEIDSAWLDEATGS